MGYLSGCMVSSASIQKLFCGSCSAFKWSFYEFVGEKVVSPSYSSAILGPPLHAVLTLSCLPQTICWILLWFPKGLFLSKLISPLWWSFPEWWVLPSPSAPHKSFWSIFFFILLFLSSVFHSFRCPKSYANVQQVLCGNCSVCRWIICVLMKSNKFCILLFCHLDSSVVIFLSALVVKTIFLFFFFFILFLNFT